MKREGFAEREIIEYLLGEIRRGILEDQSLHGDEEIYDYIEERVLQGGGHGRLPLGSRKKIIDYIFFTVRKELGILQPYVEDEAVTEIMVNGDQNIFIEKGGSIQKLDMGFISTEELEEIIRRIAASVHREINELNPIVDARLKNGSRVHAVYKNVALNGPTLTIRKFPKKAFDMEDMIGFGTITREAGDFLRKMVVYGANQFISGGTSSGKTSMLNVLSNFIPSQERIIVIEDSAELQINSVENIVRMECRNANVNGAGMVDMQQLIKASLRMRPNRIIVGEVRGKEVLDMLQAFNTGHDGSLSTGHGNSVAGMLRRMENMVMQAADFPVESIREQIAEAVDIMVHMGRIPSGERKVLEICEICGYSQGKYDINCLYSYHMEKGLLPTGNRLRNREKLMLKGMCFDE